MRTSAVPPTERIASLDVVRGVALYGVMAMNLVVDGFRVSIFERFLPETTPKPWLDRVVENFLLTALDLKAFALFSFLFGIGLAIQFDRLPPARRTGWLVGGRKHRDGRRRFLATGRLTNALFWCRLDSLP